MLRRRRPARAEGNPGEMKDGRITHLGQQVCWVWQELPVPVIAAVHGHALGGGLQIALGADIRIVHPDTKLSVREVHWGLVPDMTGTFILSQLVRPDVAKELTFTARVFSGTEAYELGLATRLSDNPYDDAMALAVEIAGRSPGAVRGSKALFNRLTTPGAAEQFAAERSVIGAQIGSAEPDRGGEGRLREPAAGVRRRRLNRPIRRSPGLQRPADQFRMFTARAMTITATTSEIAAWRNISIFAQWVTGIVSVGLNAVALVNASQR